MSDRYHFHLVDFIQKVYNPQNRIKMAALTATLGSIFFPFGTGLVVLSESLKLPLACTIIGFLLAAMGLVLLLLAFNFTLKEENDRKIRQINLDQRADQRHQEILQLLRTISSNTKNTQSEKDKNEL